MARRKKETPTQRYCRRASEAALDELEAFEPGRLVWWAENRWDIPTRKITATDMDKYLQKSPRFYGPITRTYTGKGGPFTMRVFTTTVEGFERYALMSARQLAWAMGRIKEPLAEELTDE